MAETQTTGGALESVSMEGSDLASLLKKEFKPKTDEAKSAVEQAVQTLAQQALSQTQLIGKDVVKSIEAMIAAIDRKLTEQVNQILHHEDFQKLEGAWRGLHYLVNNTETDEMLKIRVMNISKTDLGKTLKHYKGTAWDQSPSVQEGLRRGIRPVRRRAVRLPGGRLPLRPERARRGNARRDGQGRGRRACAVHHRRLAHGDADGLLAGTGQPARPDQDLHDARIRRVALAARVGRRQVPRPGDAALPVAPALRRQDEPGGGVRLRGRHRLGRPQQVHLGQRGLCHGGEHQPLVQGIRLVLAHPRHRVGRRGAEPAHAHASRPTTAAWT